MEKYTEIKKWYSEQFSEFVQSLNGSNPPAVKEIREKAYDRFKSLDFPTVKDEEWRYTNISPILKHNFKASNSVPALTKEQIQSHLYENMDCCLLVFINGVYSKEHSQLPDEFKTVKIGSLSEALRNNDETAKKYFGKAADFDNQIFTALNTAYVMDGAYIHVPDNKVIEKPIHLLMISYGKEVLSQPRNLIVAGKHSQVTVVEHYVGKDGDVYLSNNTTEIYVGEDAVVDHVRIQEESRTAFHIGRMEVEQERGSNFASHLFSTGGEISRNNFNVKFNNEFCESTLNGLYLIKDSQLFDAHTMIDHAMPNCNSHEHFKGILDDTSRGVFNGKVMVRRDAQKTNAFQENNNIILSNDALVNTKPQLEIFADDVKCSHGATIGQLDEDALFYLKSRGIGEEASRSILLHAFASDVVRTIKVNAVKDHIEKILTEKFEK